MTRPARMLVVAGHDPTGGAGVDADREAAERFGVELDCVVTADTDQDGRRVSSIGARDPTRWLSEARALCRPRPLALKSGLLPGAEHVRAFATLVRELGAERERPPVVVDPVLAASGGEPFLDDEGCAVLVRELLPLDVVLTPNVPEAARLIGGDAAELARSSTARLAAAHALLAAGARAVVLKGGHASEDPARDLVLEHDREPVWCTHPRIAGADLHGSGCRFASALCAGLARGHPLERAAREAGEWLAVLLAASSGAGPEPAH